MTGEEVARALEAFGWEKVNILENHIIMTKIDHVATLSIPNMNNIARGTLRSLIEKAKIHLIDKSLTGEEAREILWRQYNTHVDLYKHYLELTLKLNIFYYAVTGAILSFYFTRQYYSNMIRLSLVLPCLMSILFGSLLLYSSILLKVTRKEVFNIRNTLGLQSAPEFNILKYFLIASAVLFFTVAIALLIFFFFDRGKIGGTIIA
jgi:predicted RNA binding protein YcfA (HicA-like mRNA interferase family)